MWVENLYELKRCSVGSVSVIKHDPRKVLLMGERIRYIALFRSGVSQMYLL